MITTKTTYMPSTPEEKKLREVEELKKCNSYSSRQITSDPSICGGMPINGLEHGTPIQGKALTLGNKVEQIDTQVTILNGIITDINTKLFLIPPQGNTNMDKSNPLDCIDDYVNNIHCAILDANEMLTNIVNKL